MSIERSSFAPKLVLRRVFSSPVAALLCASALTGCGDAGLSHSETEASSVQEPVYFSSSLIWSDRTIDVCWENANAATSTLRLTAQEAIDRTWGGLTELQFNWSDKCPETGGDLRIRIEDSHPRVNNKFGTDLRGIKDGIFLNLNFATYRGIDPGGVPSRRCDETTEFTSPYGRTFNSVQQFCIEATTIHEFGHALGIYHEDTRPNPPGWCTPEVTDEGHDMWGKFDAAAMMSSCAVRWIHEGLLSPAEVAWAHNYYGHGSQSYVWSSKGVTKDYTTALGYPVAVLADIQAFPTATSGKPLVGDFDDDNRDDVFIYNPGGTAETLYWGAPAARSGFTLAASSSVPSVNYSSYIPVVGNFDGEDGDDILWYAPGEDADYTWWSQGGKIAPFEAASSAHSIRGTFTPLTGDFDGDGLDDIYWYAPGTADDYMWWGSGRTFTKPASFQQVSGIYRPVVFNFDGEFGDDILWYAPGDTVDYIWKSVGSGTRTSFNVVEYALGGDYRPVAGDFGLSEAEDLILNDPTTAMYDTTIFGAFGKGQFTSIDGTYAAQLSGDFDGNGRDDILFYKRQ